MSIRESVAMLLKMLEITLATILWMFPFMWLVVLLNCIKLNEDHWFFTAPVFREMPRHDTDNQSL